jgi:hypothetical protein
MAFCYTIMDKAYISTLGGLFPLKGKKRQVIIFLFLETLDHPD